MNAIAPTNTFPTLSFDNILLPEREAFDFSEIYKEEDVVQELTEFYQLKEQEWIKLTGEKRWFALSEEKRDFLIRSAGAIDLGEGINIKEGYKYYE